MDSIKRAVTGPWGSAAGLMTEESMEDVERMFPFQEEPERARLLLSPLFLRKTVLDALRPSLSGLKRLASQDRGEWVEMLCAAVDEYDGRIHTDKVLEALPKVKSSIEEVESLAEAIDPSLHRPLVEKFLSDDVLKQIGAFQYRKDAGKLQQPTRHSHFSVRDPPQKSVAGHQPQGAGAPTGRLDPHQEPRAMHGVAPTTNGFGLPLPNNLKNPRKRPAMPGSETSMFLKPTKPKLSGRGGHADPSTRKKPVVLDITSIKQVRNVTEKRRVELEKEKEELKEKEAQERAEERKQKKENIQERRNFMRDSERRKKEKAREERRQKQEDERERVRGTKAPVDGDEVAEALKAARNKADMEASKEIENIDAYQIDTDDDDDSADDFI